MRKTIRIILFTILIIDLGYSFYQHYHMSLGGDLSHIIVPSPETGYYRVLHDPFALSVLLENNVYSTPNRFFAHWTASKYFKNIPILLQKFVSPIDSVYLATAIAKILIQFLIIYLLAVYISNNRNILKLDFLIAATLIFPLFQTSGYNRYMGIIDQSVIYTFFYALPLGLLLLFYLPFFRNLYHNKKSKLNAAVLVLLAVLTIVLSLNGPLVPGVVLIICPLVLLNLWFKIYKQSEIVPYYKRAWNGLTEIPKYVLIYFLGISVFCLYSLYIGQNDAMSISSSIPILERYARLPAGIYYLLTSKVAYPLLFLMIIVNVIVIRKNYKSHEAGKLLTLLKWIGIFAILYVLLLPLGGYRVYRENIIRYDSMMPVTMGIMFVFGATTYYLIKNMYGRNRSIYISGVLFLLLIFTNSDRLDTEGYRCERKALETIAESREQIVKIESDCPVMDWRIIRDYNLRELDAELLYYWNITDEKKLFYQSD